MGVMASNGRLEKYIKIILTQVTTASRILHMNVTITMNIRKQQLVILIETV